jgi:large subunit ribosomal protein L4
MELEVRNLDNRPVGRVHLDENLFAAKVNEALVWEDVRHYRAMQRQGTASTKTRGEVSGGGKKPWRQKGTGRARHGSIRSPLWRHGGTTFGPKPRDYSYRLPQKKRWGALRSALSQKAGEGAVSIIESAELAQPKTKALAAALAALGFAGKKILLVDEPVPRNLALAARNLPKVATARPMALRSYDVLHADAVVFTKGALEALQKGAPQ